MYYSTRAHATQAPTPLATETQTRLAAFLQPLLRDLDRQLDARLVRTLLATVRAILTFRHRAYGLLLSELGAYVLAPAHAPAGTKRLSNLLRSPRWCAADLTTFLWRQAEQRRTALQAAGEDSLVIWDSTVAEAPESVRLPDLCAVRSSKAQRLKRIKPGFFNPPGGRPICVPGMHWLGLLLLGRTGPPTVATMHWWTTRGPHASDRRREEDWLLAQCVQAWGRQVIHIWDRGVAHGRWLSQALEAHVRFVLRWKKGQYLLDPWGVERKAWEITRGQRSWGTRWLWDQRTRQQRKYGVVACNVTYPGHARPMWLVVARAGGRREPWYLLTSDPIRTVEDAWAVVLAYARRWQIEMAWRYSKSELAMESPRLWQWERRLKLLLLATLAYAFLLTLLAPAALELRRQLLQRWCHRTGKRSRATPTPLYRVRAALSRLWLTYPVASAPPGPGGNSG